MPRSYPYVALAGKQLAPALRILIQSGDKQDEEIALLDTGANATAINAGVLESLDLRPVGEHRVSGAHWSGIGQTIFHHRPQHCRTALSKSSGISFGQAIHHHWKRHSEPAPNHLRRAEA